MNEQGLNSDRKAPFECNDSDCDDKDNSWIKNYQNDTELFLYFYERVRDTDYIFELIDDANNLNKICELHQTTRFFWNLENPIRKKTGKYICENKNFINVCNALDLRMRFFGERYVVANQPLKPNTIIADEIPIISYFKPNCICVKNPSHHCHYCGNLLILFLACDKCEMCLYCNKQCMDKAWSEYHKWECDGMSKHYWNENAYLAMRMLFIGIPTKFNDNIEVNEEYQFIDETEKYALLNSLKSEINNMKPEHVIQILKDAMRTLVYFIERTDFFHMIMLKNVFPGKTLYECYMEIGARLFQHQCQAIVNVLRCGHFNRTVTEITDPIRYTSQVLCLSISMFNHSCDPNAVLLMSDNRIVMKLLRPVQAEEEICINYYDRSNTLIRYSKESALFICTCATCRNPIAKELRYAYKCDIKTCNGKVPCSTFKCTKCNTKLSADYIKEKNLETSKYEEEFKKQNDYFNLNLAVKTYETIAHEDNLNLAEFYIETAYYLTDKRFTKSYCNFTSGLAIYKKHYPEFSLLLLNKLLEYVNHIALNTKLYCANDTIEVQMVMKALKQAKAHAKFYFLQPKVDALKTEIYNLKIKLKSLETDAEKVQSKKND